jgi:hypothetical protein
MSLFDSSYSAPCVLSFNSKDRIGGTNSSFISIPQDLGSNKYDSVCLVQASIPKSFYNMPTGYNQFTLVELGVSRTITIPVGSYNKNNLMLVLAPLLTAASVLNGNNWTYAITYPSISTQADTFKYTFTVTGNSGNQPSFIFSASSPFRQLGFDVATYTFSAGSLSSIGSINLSYVLRMFIKSNISSTANNGILEEILNVGSYPPLSVVYFQQYNFDMNTKTYDSSNTNSWSFTLVDSYDQIVDLNNVPWAFTIVFYQRNNTHELHKTDLQIQNEQRLFTIAQQQQGIQTSVQGLANNPLQTPALEPIIYGTKPRFDRVLPELLPSDIIYPTS